jgi:hypothetical protein
MQAAKRAAPAGGRSPRSASLFSLSKRRSKAVNALQQLGLLHIWALHTWRRLAAPRTALTAPFLAVPSTLDSRSQLLLWRLLLLFQWRLVQFFLVVSSCYPIFQKCWYWRPSEREPRFIAELFDWEFFYTQTQVLQNDDDSRSWMCGLF